MRFKENRIIYRRFQVFFEGTKDVHKNRTRFQVSNLPSDFIITVSFIIFSAPGAGTSTDIALRNQENTVATFGENSAGETMDIKV